jgi:hypothetical protein
MADKLPVWKGRLLQWLLKAFRKIKTTLSAVSIHVATNIELPPWLLKAFRKIVTAFLWLGEEDNKGGCLVAWQQVQCPMQLSGLGVLDLQRQGVALCLGWCWLAHADRSKP